MLQLFFYFFIAWVLRETYGHYDSSFVLLLTTGYSLTLLGMTLPKQIFACLNKTLFSKILFSVAVLYFCAALWMSPGIVYSTSPTLLSRLTELLAVLFGVAAVLVAAASVKRFGDLLYTLRITFWLAAALLLATRVLTLLISPNPYIDGFTLTTRASDYLLSGLNPYTQTYADLYNGGYDYTPGLNYWPAYYLWSAPFRWLGDIRLGNIFADAVTLILLLKLMAEFGVDESLSYLVALSWLSFPVSLFVLEQAWIEPVIIMLMTGLIWCGWTKRWVVAGILLGALSGMKQHMLLLSVLTLFYFYRHCARREFYKVLGWTGVTFTMIVAPFLLASPQAFIRQTIVTYLQREIRVDSLSLTAYLANEHNLFIANWPLITVYLVAFLISAVVMFKANPATWHHWSIALFISYGVLFLIGKQAFCNYYYLLAFIALLAQVASGMTQAGRTIPVQSGFAEYGPRRE